jgi:hypothetical protein
LVKRLVARSLTPSPARARRHGVTVITVISLYPGLVISESVLEAAESSDDAPGRSDGDADARDGRTLEP